MKIILSPAKTFHPKITHSDDLPHFKREANHLMTMLKKVSPDAIQSSMKLSEKLLTDVIKMIHAYDQTSSKVIYTYHGQAFKSFDVNSLKESDLSFMQDHILILSGLYGVLKPNDGISLYRLEMQDQTLFNLYDYWKPKIGTYLKTYCKDEVIINLASEEYSKVIPSSIKMITLDFIEMIKGRQKRIAMHVKTMRGLCARYLIQNRITSIDDIKMITLNGYSYDSKRSTADLFVFTKEV
ncbi:MAG TPA: hypothetical protein DHV05_07850 [Acholeplasmataceae bacterium]|nr:hypothetical protein [Acholeplasmataceae bacterium]